jgi:hypothetical protein
MLRRKPLVAVFVIAGFARHQLLLIFEWTVVGFGDEINRRIATQRRDVFSVMRNPDFTVFVFAERETEIGRIALVVILHCAKKIIQIWSAFVGSTCLQKRQSETDWSSKYTSGFGRNAAQQSVIPNSAADFSAYAAPPELHK